MKRHAQGAYQAHHTRPARTTRGAALLVAMLLVATVASLTSFALWRQWAAVQVESAERGRVQATWILNAALDWARLILREDARSGGADHLAEPWAVPLQEARLSSFLRAERGVTTVDDDEAADQVFLSGQILDMQARINVLSLVEGERLSESAMNGMARLFVRLGLPPAELQGLGDALLRAVKANEAQEEGPSNNNANPSDATPLLPQRVEQLIWLGLSANTLERLKPYITLLPTRVPLNLNTASAEVLYASAEQLSYADAQKLVAARASRHFRTLGDALAVLGTEQSPFDSGRHSVASRYFEVHGQLRLGDLVVRETSLVLRDGLEVKTLWRQRWPVPVKAAAS